MAIEADPVSVNAVRFIESLAGMHERLGFPWLRDVIDRATIDGAGNLTITSEDGQKLLRFVRGEPWQ